jgi:peptidoglycan-associated lipoprotein
MNRRNLVGLSMGLLLVATACHKNPPPGTDVKPTPGGGSTTQPGGGERTPPPPPPPPPTTTTTVDGFNANVAMMGERIHFDYNESTVRADDNARLDAKAALLKRFPALRIRITGHADERGSDQYNIALGKRRADAAKDYLVRVGIDASRIETSSLGREVPADPGHDDNAWAQNRRDEFDVIAGTQSMRVP